jgi:putative ABC transport system substrate-binding protein
VSETTRRSLLVGTALALAGVRIAAAQERRPRRVVLYATSDLLKLVLEALRERGWVEDRTLVFDWRRVGEEQTEAHIRDDVARGPIDVMVVAGANRLRGAMRAAPATPIIALDLESDPVKSGFVKSLGRPGGMVTGIWMDLPEIAGKQLQFARDIVPGVERVGVIWDDRIGAPQIGEAQAAARAARITLVQRVMRREDDAEAAMKGLATERVQAVVLLTAPVVFQASRRLAELARQQRWPSISPFSTFPAEGGLLGYGPDFPAMWRQLAGYVDRVLRGASAGDLPVERPSKFTFVLNLKTAREIGVTIPRVLLERADEVIR